MFLEASVGSSDGLEAGPGGMLLKMQPRQLEGLGHAVGRGATRRLGRRVSFILVYVVTFLPLTWSHFTVV